MYAEFTTPISRYPKQLEREGRQDWFDILAGVGEVEEPVRVLMARYGYKPQGFDKSGRAKTREAYDLLGGRKRQSPDDPAGAFGRFVVIVGLPFEVSTISFSEMPELALFSELPEAQFDQEIISLAQKAVEHVVTGPYFLVPERGRESGQNHLHVAHRADACSLGRKTLNSTAEDALKCARYFSKGPDYQLENLVGCANAVRLQGRPAKRIRYGRLGSRRITCGEVEQVLGFSVLRPTKDAQPKAAVSSEPNAPPVIQKHVWYGGQPQPISRELLKPEPVTLFRSLPSRLEKLADSGETTRLRPAPSRRVPQRHIPIAVARWGVSPPAL